MKSLEEERGSNTTDSNSQDNHFKRDVSNLFYLDVYNNYQNKQKGESTTQNKSQDHEVDMLKNLGLSPDEIIKFLCYQKYFTGSTQKLKQENFLEDNAKIVCKDEPDTEINTSIFENMGNFEKNEVILFN